MSVKTDWRQVVASLKRELVSYCYSGEASRVRGIIVSSALYQALGEDSDHFHGVIRVTGREGNRSLRYSFYVLENSNYPVGAEPFFFVGYTEEVYRERYLGREEAILATPRRQSIKIGWKTITEVNPVHGVIEVSWSGGSRWYYNVDFDQIVEVAQTAYQANESVLGACERFGRYRLVNNPPETRWIKDETAYNYDRANRTASVGRLLMRRFELLGNHFYHIVGIARDGYGHVVDVDIPESSFACPLDFAKQAVRYFLPEEVADFLAQSGVALPVEEIAQHAPPDVWGSWYDREDAGRLHARSWSQGDKKGYEVSVDLLGSRAKVFSFDIHKQEAEAGWPELKAKYFPPDWHGWAKTSQLQAMEAFAHTL